MSRWRPPRPISSPYITPEGYQALETELRQLWDKRKIVTAAVTTAAAEGDRSENAEYIYRKKELRGIDSRIHFLQKRLPSLTIVSEKPANREQVFFGARVTLKKMDGDEVTYRIIGPDEIESSKGYISMDSPLAKVLLKKQLDDEVVMRNEVQETRYYIVGIEY